MVIFVRLRMDLICGPRLEEMRVVAVIIYTLYLARNNLWY